MFRLKLTFRPLAQPEFAQENRRYYFQGVLLAQTGQEWFIADLGNGDLVATAHYQLPVQESLLAHAELMKRAQALAFGLPLIDISVNKVASRRAKHEAVILAGATHHYDDEQQLSLFSGALIAPTTTIV